MYKKPKTIANTEFARGYILEMETDNSVALNQYSGRKDHIEIKCISIYSKEYLLNMKVLGKQEELVKEIKESTKGKSFVIREEVQEYFS